MRITPMINLCDLSEESSIALESRPNSENNISDDISSMDMDISQNNFCIICFTNYGQASVSLPCNHTFHIYCIIKWSITQHDQKIPVSCPICKSQYDFPKFIKQTLHKYIEQIETTISQLAFILYNAKLVKSERSKLIKLKNKYYRTLRRVKRIKDPINTLFLKQNISSLPHDIIELFYKTKQDIQNRSTNIKFNSYKDIIYIVKNPKIIFRFLMKIGGIS